MITMVEVFRCKLCTDGLEASEADLTEHLKTKHSIVTEGLDIRQFYSVLELREKNLSYAKSISKTVGDISFDMMKKAGSWVTGKK